MKADLQQQIQQLKEERIEADFNAYLWSARNLTCSSPGRGRRPYDRVQPKNKPVAVNGPCIVYQLHEHKIQEDWTIIKKSLLELKRKEDDERRNKIKP